ncbi:MAG: beta-propeller fold lactonase family protein, partial [Spirochaetia bacterium]|nr:beta-propeller fold lactonase family protein [Spirochaetia bacterium]
MLSATKVLNVTRLTRSVVIAGVFLTGSLLVSCGLFKPECTGDDPACNQILFALRPRAAYGRVLYASTTGGTDHRVYAFAMNRNTGALTALGTPVGAGNDPTTLTIDPSGRFLYATGSATGANVYPYTIQSDGTLMPGTAITASGTAPRQMVFSADPTVAVLQ